MNCFNVLVALLLTVHGTLTSPVVSDEDPTGCAKLSCAHNEYCIGGITEARCTKELKCSLKAKCPIEGTICRVLQFPCTYDQCPYFETCQYSCDAIDCNIDEVCELREGSPPFCVNKSCHNKECPIGLQCVAIRETCLHPEKDCPLTPKCINPEDVCDNYECEQDYRCVASRDHCVSPECVSKPKCELDFCSKIECGEGEMCVEFGPNCEVGSEECLRAPKCVRKDSPCEIYECDQGQFCQETSKHCIDDGSDCQILPECVNQEDPCLDYECKKGYYCREDTTHCQHLHGDICVPWAVCEKHVRTCDDIKCKKKTHCEMLEGDCEDDAQACPVCVPDKKKKGKSLQEGLLTLKLAKKSKFKKIVYKGALGFFIAEHTILDFLEGLKEKMEKKKEIIKEVVTDVTDKLKEKNMKKKKKLQGLLTDDVDAAIGMFLSPSEVEVALESVRPPKPLLKPIQSHKPLLKPIQSHKPFLVTSAGTSIYFDKGFRPLKKHHTKPKPRPTSPSGKPRPLYYKRPSMSVFYTSRYGYSPSGRSKTDQENVIVNGTETGSYNSTSEGNELDEYGSVITVHPKEEGTRKTGVGRIEYEYKTMCGEEGILINLRTLEPFSGTVSYLDDKKKKICHTHRVDNTTNISVHLPYANDCDEGELDFRLQHFIQIDWDDGQQEKIALECELQSRGRLETKVTIDPEKTKSVKDIKSDIQQFLLLFDKNGRPITGNVHLGETVQLYYTVGTQLKQTFDVDVMNCWATAEDENFREQIVKDSCPVHPEKIKGPHKTYIPNRLDKYNTYDIIYVIKTYPINGSLNVKYSCDVRVCMPECSRKIHCRNNKKSQEREQPEEESQTMMMQAASH